MQQTNSITVTIPNPSAAQVAALANILAGDTTPVGTTSASPLAGLTTPVKRTRKKAAPAPTVSKDEDEDFGDEALDEEDLEAADDTDEDDADVDADDEEDEGLSFEDVRTVMNKYGNKNPTGMKAILTAFNVKSTKELEKNPKKWEAVYRKVQAKLKPVKK